MLINQRTMIGTNVYTLTNLLTIEGPLIRYFIYQKNVKTITLIQVWVVEMNVNFHIQHSRDYTILISIKLIPVNSIIRRRNLVKRQNCVPSYILTKNLDTYPPVIRCCCLIDSRKLISLKIQHY